MGACPSKDDNDTASMHMRSETDSDYIRQAKCCKYCYLPGLHKAHCAWQGGSGMSAQIMPSMICEKITLRPNFIIYCDVSIFNISAKKLQENISVNALIFPVSCSIIKLSLREVYEKDGDGICDNSSPENCGQFTLGRC